MRVDEFYYRLFDQEQFPIWTAISFATTVAIETLIAIAANSLSGASFGAIGIVLFAGFFVAIGVVVNVVAGCQAHKRREYLGGRIAAIGIGLWLATILWTYHALGKL